MIVLQDVIYYYGILIDKRYLLFLSSILLFFLILSLHQTHGSLRNESMETQVGPHAAK